MATKRAKTALIYGPSGVGKTNQLFRLVRWILAKAHKTNPKARVRLIHADGGGWAPFEDSGYIEKGWVEAFDVSKREEALADIRRLGDGFWPINIGTKREKFDRTCETKDWENIAAYVIEGITSISMNWLDHFADQEAGMGFKHSWIIQEAEYTIGGLDRGHYGIVQKEVHKLVVHAFNSLPVPWVLWSALVTGKAQDPQTKEYVIGPECAGNAVTHKIPQWLGTTLYLEGKESERKDGSKLHWVAAHFEKGVDDDSGKPFVAKSRIMEELYPKFKEKFPNGYVDCVSGKRGIERYFETEEQLLEEYNKQSG